MITATPIRLQPQRELLKRTTSRCPICHRACPAEVWRAGSSPAKVLLERVCPTHGRFSACLASDARFYWLSKGDPANADGGCCGGGSCCAADGSATGTLGRNAAGRGDGPFEKLSTCLALIEIVNSCNLSCPTCYADSPLGTGAKVDAVPLDELKLRIQGVVDRKGGIEILQLSGGEPTLHPQFFELLEWAQAHEGIDFVLVNTNGVRIAHDPDFTLQLEIAARRKGLQLYLQFDGPQPGGQRALRGADLRSTRELALARCAGMDLPVTLAMTVTPENLDQVWGTIESGLARPIVHGVTFQPIFGSGRIPVEQVAANVSSWQSTQAINTPDPDGLRNPGLTATDSRRQLLPAGARLNTADILLAAVAQSGGRLKFDDFTPLPCGDPNCATIGYLLRLGGQVHSVSEFLDFAKLQGFLHDKINYRLEDLARCGCEAEPLGEVLKSLELKASVAFRIMVKPFMDAWTWDQDRIDRCCTHAIRPDGKLDSFCRYYSGFPDTRVVP